VLAASREGEAPRQLYKKDGKMVWASRIRVAGGPGTGVEAGDHGGRAATPGWYVALFNIGDSAQTVVVDFAQLGVRGRATVRDCWKRADAGIFDRSYSRIIPPHGAVLVKIKINKSSK
jgi:alpha-galactosidase